VKPFFLLRLVVDFTTMGLLVGALAYFAFDNATHEVIGTAMFSLLVGHNIFNRRWYRSVPKKGGPRAAVTKVVNMSLLGAMLSLLVTSVIISQSVFSFLPLTSTFTVRQVHTMVAYLVLLVAAVHLGLHWTMIMGVVRTLLRTNAGGRIRSIGLRAIAALGAAYGLLSLFEANVGQKLLMQSNFGLGGFAIEPVAFALQHGAIVWLGACIGHYTLALVRRMAP